MSLELITSPEKTINGLLSNVNAGRSQLPYLFEREDYPKGFTDDAGGDFARFYIAGIDVTSEFPIGTIIFVHSPQLLYNSLTIVTAVIFDNGDTRLTTDLLYLGNETGGYINNITTKPGYKANIKILDGYNPSTGIPGSELLPLTFRFAPETSGRIFVDVGQILTNLQEILPDNSLIYALEYWESWDGSLGAARLSNVFLLAESPGHAGFIGVQIDVNFANDYPIGTQVHVITDNYNAIGLVLGLDGANVIAVNIPYLANDGAGTIEGVASLAYSNNIQTLYAKKQIGLQGGSNLWEYLLRTNEGINEVADIGNDGTDRPQVTPVLDNTMFFVGQLVVLNAPPLYNNILCNIYQLFSTTAVTLDTAYLGFQSGNVKISPIQAKLLTKFISTPPAPGGGLAQDNQDPFIWRGWRRTVSYLIDEYYFDRILPNIGEPQLNMASTDINKIFIPGSGSNKNPSNTDPQIITRGIDVANVIIEYFPRVRVIDSGTGADYSEFIFYKILDECPKPIMIEWLSSLGAPEQHLFSINQEVNIQASEGLSYITPHSQDQENIHKDKNRIFSEERQTLLLIAESLTNNQIKALAEIKTSTQVEAYLTKDGSERIGVITRDVLASGYETASSRDEFRLVIEMPDNYDFFEAKNY